MVVRLLTLFNGKTKEDVLGEKPAKDGVVRVAFKNPVTALAGYFEATGRSKADLEESISVNRSILYKAINGTQCSKDFGLEIEKITGLDKALVAFMERREVWAFALFPGERVKILDNEEWDKIRSQLSLG